MASQIPPLLEAYLSLPDETALILLTGILGASTNWLTLRYVYSFLKPAAPLISRRQDVEDDNRANLEVDSQECVAVLLVSFMRDYEFWKEGAGRLGLDLESLLKQNRFAFVDGLSDLFTVEGPSARPIHPSSGYGTGGRHTLTSPDLKSIARVLNAAVGDLAKGGGKVVLVLDQPDLLLAAAPDKITHGGLGDVLLDLRERVHATVVTLAADEPLVAAQGTTLEREHAALVLSLAHEAELVVSLRLLDTGVANDVSGVVRVTGGGAQTGVGREVEERELLYRIGADGGVKVFERGQGH